MSTNPARLAQALAWIDHAYEQMATDPGFIFRDKQRAVSVAVATSFIDKIPLLNEAPTGTGKTVGYLIGALAAHLTAVPGTTEPIVVSTATKALQQQLVDSDLPKLIRAGLLPASAVGIVKGKGNYLCLSQAMETEALLTRGESDSELFLDASREGLNAFEIGAMVQSFEDSYWDGDFDSYEGTRPKSVFPIAVSSDTCTRKKCQHYSDCAYYRARSKLQNCTILVVNHDLLLLDLKLVDEGLEPTLPLANYHLVVDEAHHLPEKAIKVGSSEAQLSRLAMALPKLAGAQRLLERNPALEKLAASANVKAADLDRLPLANALRELTDTLQGIRVDEDNNQFRFRNGEVPAPVLESIYRTSQVMGNLLVPLTKLAEVMREKSGSLGPELAERASEVLHRTLEVKRLADECQKTFAAFKGTTRVAKWLFRKDQSTALHSAPLEGAVVLTPLLWNSPRVLSVSMVSATLRDVAGFNRFRVRAGVPESAKAVATPYSFPYAQSELRVKAMKATPKLAERREFLAELHTKLPNDLQVQDAALVLFPSWAMLKEFAPRLKARFGDRIRVQGDQVVKLLVRDHCRAVDNGKSSILLGVATLAEGLDLPGKYCTHVAIISLPFAVPTDPVEQELADVLGNRYFGERSLPDAMVRLTQMVGRLLRRETDVGSVSVYDRRLASTSYGRQMLAALPPFKKVIEPMPS